MSPEDFQNQATNPYEPPIQAELVASITPFQRKSLVAYLEYRESPPTIMRLVAKTWWYWFLLLPFASFVLLLGLAVNIGLNEDYNFLPLIIVFIAGFLFGKASYLLSIFRQFINLWPALRDVLDWNRVEEKLGA